jgi:hypothetical protein
MRHSDHGIVKDERGQEQPTDKARAQTAQKSDPGKSATREATRDPKLNDKENGFRHGARRSWHCTDRLAA